MKIILLLILLYLSLYAEVYSKQAIIVLNKDANHIELFAGQELKKHLQLILNKKIMLCNVTANINFNTYKYIFHIGKNEIKKPFKNEESRYLVDNHNIYLYGDDFIQKKKSTPVETITYMYNKTGTLFSVYDFLYNELHVRWIEPGNIGIIYPKLSSLNLKDSYFHWYPNILFRRFRNDIWNWNKIVKNRDMFKYTPKKFQPTKEFVKKKEQEELIWMRRMKQGIYNKPNYGHAFIHYWELYGKKHSEWFALGKNNKRGLAGSKSKKEKYIKLCVSNNNLQNQIVENYKNQFIKYHNNIYNACINDSRNYCRCSKCRKLDNDYRKKPSKKFEIESKTDRYVYFWNQLIEKSKKFNPHAKIIAYAYSDYRYPPKKYKLKDDIILGFVPKFSDIPSVIKKNIIKWKKKGLNKIFLRPNDFNDDIGMPMGHEKFIFDRFSVFKNLKLYGVDYDRNYNFANWNYDSITYYILAQAIIFPNKTYLELEDEYFKTFGRSQKYIKKFYHYWRKNFEQKRLNKIGKYGGYSGRKNIYKNIKLFYTLEDFEITNRFLENALKSTKNLNIRQRIQRLIISNTHSKLLFLAILDKKSNYKHLIEFRLKYQQELNLSWPVVFYVERHLDNLYILNKMFTKVMEYLNLKL